VIFALKAELKPLCDVEPCLIHWTDAKHVTAELSNSLSLPFGDGLIAAAFAIMSNANASGAAFFGW